MYLIYSVNAIIFIVLSIIGISLSIKNETSFVELTNFQIDRKTIVGFSIMGFTGAVIMLLIFLTNQQLGFTKIESTNNWISSVKQIPKVFISAFGEELFFRIFIFISLIYYSGNKLIALVISSAIFCLLHNPMNLISVTSYFIAGLMYGLAFLKFKSIWAAIGLHFTWNYFQGAIFGFPVSNGVSDGYFKLRVEDNWIWNGGEIGPEGSVFGVLCRVIIIIIIFLLANKYEIKESMNFLDINKKR